MERLSPCCTLTIARQQSNAFADTSLHGGAALKRLVKPDPGFLVGEGRHRLYRLPYAFRFGTVWQAAITRTAL